MVAQDRAQLVLVGALAVAVAMVTLSLLLNGAIFTQSLAVREIDAGGHDALEYKNASVAAVADIVEDETDEEYTGGGGLSADEQVYENVSHGIERYGNLSRRMTLGESTYVAVGESLSVHNGSRLRQTDPNRNFETNDGTGDGNWTLATDTPDIRKFSLVIETVEPADTPPAGDAFTVNVTGGGNWKVFFYEDAGQLQVEVGNNSGTTTTSCGSYSPPTTVNLTAGTVDGDSCAALLFASSSSPPYDIDFTNGTNAAGTFNVTVNTSSEASPTPNVNSGNFDSPGAGQPYEVQAAYDAVVEIRYQTPKIRYADTVRVAPGEPA